MSIDENDNISRTTLSNGASSDRRSGFFRHWNSRLKTDIPQIVASHYAFS